MTDSLLSEHLACGVECFDQEGQEFDRTTGMKRVLGPDQGQIFLEIDLILHELVLNRSDNFPSPFLFFFFFL